MLALPNTQVAVVCASFGGAGTTIGGGAPGEGNVISGNVGRRLAFPGRSRQRRSRQPDRSQRRGHGPARQRRRYPDEHRRLQQRHRRDRPGEANEIAYNTADGRPSRPRAWTTCPRQLDPRQRRPRDRSRRSRRAEFQRLPGCRRRPEPPAELPDRPSGRAPRPAGGRQHAGRRQVQQHAVDHVHLDFYSNPVCSDFPREFVEGEVYLGSSPITTDPNGDFAIDETLPVETEAGARISVTATDPDGNTSEFSQRILFSIFPASGPDGRRNADQVHGTDFADPTTLTFGGAAAAVTFVNDHQLSASSPALAPGTVHDVVATTPDGTVGTLVKGWVSDFLDVPGAHSSIRSSRPSSPTASPSASAAASTASTSPPAPADGRLPHEGQARPLLRPASLHPHLHGRALLPELRPLDRGARRRGHHHRLRRRQLLPGDPVTRRQMAVLLLKTSEGSAIVPPACTGIFDDVACPGAPAVDFIERLAPKDHRRLLGGRRRTTAPRHQHPRADGRIHHEDVQPPMNRGACMRSRMLASSECPGSAHPARNVHGDQHQRLRAGSLRQAIRTPNADGTADTIAFAIPGAGVHTITPLTLLPIISTPMTIDGYTQPGSVANTNATGGLNTVLQIEIDGTNAPNRCISIGANDDRGPRPRHQPVRPRPSSSSTRSGRTCTRHGDRGQLHRHGRRRASGPARQRDRRLDRIHPGRHRRRHDRRAGPGGPELASRETPTRDLRRQQLQRRLVQRHPRKHLGLDANAVDADPERYGIASTGGARDGPDRRPHARAAATHRRQLQRRDRRRRHVHDRRSPSAATPSTTTARWELR